MPVQALTLKRHPETPSAAVHGIAVRVSRMPDGMLGITYTLEGDIGHVRAPATRPAGMGDELWQHTCCEAFVARKGLPGYHEFNFAPCGAWAVYDFERYRARVSPDEGASMKDLEPEIIARRTAETLELNALIRLDRLSLSHANAALALALAAVVEDEDGALSYWALAHPPGKPDFHHTDAFVLELDEVRD